MIDKIPHGKKIAVGTLIAVGVWITPHIRDTVKWYKKMDQTRDMARDNEKALKDLQKCEQETEKDITRLETLVNVLTQRIDRLEYRIDE